MLRIPLALFGGFALAALTLAVAIVLLDDFPRDETSVLGQQQLRAPLTTANTTRVVGDGDPFSDAAAISQMIFPATREQNKPNAVLLLNVDDLASAVAATLLAHFPVNAPILYTEPDQLPSVTATEIERLDPDGVFTDGNTEVYVLGDIGESVVAELHDMGYKTRRIAGTDPTDPTQNAEAFDQFGATLMADHADAVIVTNVEQPEYAMAGAAWNFHAGDSLLYVTDNEIPEATRDALEDRGDGAFIYIFGTEGVVSREVEILLGEYGAVERIPGENLQEIAANFAGFRDAGTNWGWWLRNVKRDFGWGILDGGHGYTIVNPAEPQAMVAAGVFSHMGKHAPMLVLNEDGTIPRPVERYLTAVRTSVGAPDGMEWNHGWIIGRESTIPPDTQLAIEGLMRPRR